MTSTTSAAVVPYATPLASELAESSALVVRQLAQPSTIAFDLAAAFHFDARNCSTREEMHAICCQYRDKVLALDDVAAQLAATFYNVFPKDSSLVVGRGQEAKRWTQFSELAKKARHRRDRHAQALRHQAGIIAFWGPVVFKHYGWRDLPYDVVRRLHDLTRLLPRWQDAVRLINKQMLGRHEQRVVQNNYKAHKIGEHATSSTIKDPCSPVERKDIMDALAWAQHQERTSTPARLAIRQNAMKIDDDLVETFSLSYDVYGMIVPRDDDPMCMGRPAKRQRLLPPTPSLESSTGSPDVRGTPDMSPIAEAARRHRSRTDAHERRWLEDPDAGELTGDEEEDQSPEKVIENEELGRDDEQDEDQETEQMHEQGGEDEDQQEGEYEEEQLAEQEYERALEQERELGEQGEMQQKVRCQRQGKLKNSKRPNSSKPNKTNEAEIQADHSDKNMGKARNRVQLVRRQSNETRAIGNATILRSSTPNRDDTPQEGGRADDANTNPASCQDDLHGRSETSETREIQGHPTIGCVHESSAQDNRQTPAASVYGDSSDSHARTHDMDDMSTFGTWPATSSGPLHTPSASVSDQQVCPHSIEAMLKGRHAQTIKRLVQHASHIAENEDDEISHHRRLQLDWLRGEHWASIYSEPSNKLGEGSASSVDADVWYLDWDAMQRHVRDGHVFDRPVIIKQQFQDSGMYGVLDYVKMLSQRFPSGSIDVQDSRTGACRSVPIHEYQAFCSRVDCSSGLDATAAVAHFSNAINLGRLARADEPLLTRLAPFQLLSTLVHRLNKSPGKTTSATRAVDIESCLGFNLLGLPGAFSRPHIDCLLGTWIRCLQGVKIWSIASDLDDEDWLRFAHEGCAWSPRGKARIVVLEQDDVLLLPPGIRVVHAVFTPEPSLAEGGMLWDERNIPGILDGLWWVAQNQACTNEAVPYQLPEIIDALEQWIDEQSDHFIVAHRADIKEKIHRLRTLGCTCISSCASNAHCSCKQSERRCTRWCRSHPELPTPLLNLKGKKRARRSSKSAYSCMSEACFFELCKP